MKPEQRDRRLKEAVEVGHRAGVATGRKQATDETAGHLGQLTEDRARLAAALAEALNQRNQLVTALSDVLRNFHEKGHPGTPCLRTGWVREEDVQRWNTTLHSLKAIDTDVLARVVIEAQP